MFFVADTTDKDANKLLIKETTYVAFLITKNAIYGITSMQHGLKGKSALEVFNVLDLVTRYQISELQTVVRNHLVSFPLTDDTVLEVASTAMEKSSTFEDEAKQMLILCAKFLETKLKNAKAVFEYVATHKDDQNVVYHLLALMNSIAVCTNCREKVCQNGNDIVQGKFRVGLCVTTNCKDYWSAGEKAWGKGIVTQMLPDDEVCVQSNNNDSNEYTYSSYDVLNMVEECVFKFCCN